jgi:hypothetical protein
MLIVVPVASSDLPLAILNLKLAAKLDAKCSLPCLISAPNGLDITELETLVREWSPDSLPSFRYDDWQGDQSWPSPQNWAWQSTARFVASITPAPQGWFWWEADATPLKSGWFSKLSKAYLEGKKPFAGHIVNGPGHGHMNGVAIYPADARPYSSNAFLTRRAPFDRVLAQSINSSHIHAINELISHHVKDGRSSFVTTPENASELLASTAVIHHGSSDGSLASIILGSKPDSLFQKLLRNLSTSLISSKPVSDVTVVITNYQRADMLWDAFESTRKAKVANVVISSSGANSAVAAVHDRIRKAMPSVVISSRNDDGGCNENWLRGVSLSKTARTTILHDDDLLLPTYEKVVAGEFPADVIHWDGAKHTPKGPFPGNYITAGTLPQGIYPITYLYQFLLNPQANTLSPVCGCFPTDHIISTLEECDKQFGSWAFLRPTMMVGNDLLLWLRACQKYRTFHYSHEPFCSYGHHAGSASYDDATKQRMKLLPIYKATRDYFIGTIPKMVHCINRFLPSDPANRARISNAAASWDIGYHYEFIVPRHQWAWKRDATSIGEKVPTPFLRDILTRAMNESTSRQDIIVLTNDDTIVNQYFWFEALDKLKARGAGCSFRRNITASDQINCWLYPEKPPGVQHCGRDAFFFTQEWLRENLSKIPDYIVGFCDWDSTLAMLIRLSNGHKSTLAEFSVEHPSSEIQSRFIYHVDHSANWARTFDHVGNKHSRALTNEWFKKNLGWPMPKLREGKW